MTQYHGMQFIHELLTCPEASLRLQRKLMFLLMDITQTQDKVFPDEPKYVSEYMNSRPDYVQTLIDLLVKASMDMNNG